MIEYLVLPRGVLKRGGPIYGGLDAACPAYGRGGVWHWGPAGAHDKLLVSRQFRSGNIFGGPGSGRNPSGGPCFRWGRQLLIVRFS